MRKLPNMTAREVSKRFSAPNALLRCVGIVIWRDMQASAPKRRDTVFSAETLCEARLFR